MLKAIAKKPIQISTYIIIHNVPKQVKHLPIHQNFRHGLNYDRDILSLNLSTCTEEDLKKYHLYVQTLVHWMNEIHESETFEQELWQDILL
jgi:hypothetical protein